MQVAQGIEKVDGIRISNAYLVLADDGLVLIDSGMPGSAGRILAAIGSLGRQPGELRTIVLTHWHIDHVGSAAELRRQTGAQVAIHELDAPVLAGKEHPQKGRRTMALITRLFRHRPFAPDLLLRDGDRVGDLRVLHMGGHTAGSIVLQRDDGVVLSGDALISNRHGRLLAPDPRLALDPARAAASAEKIRALPFTQLLPGHGVPVSA